MRHAAKGVGWCAVCALAAGLWVGPGPVSAQTSLVAGQVEAVDSGSPIGFAQILLDEIRRSATSGEDGSFVIRNVPPGTYSLKAFRIGFHTLEQTVEVPPGDSVFVTVRMHSSVIEIDEVIVQDDRGGQSAEPAFEVEGARLRRNLGTTIAETLSSEPGLSMRSMGPAPARPVLRGLGGERLLVLEDGARTGDLSQTSSDHALVVDPITADRLEVVRGPAALIYGPNTLGGAINVVRNVIPPSRPDRLHATLSLQGQSVSEGVAVGAVFSAPLPADLSLRVDGLYRSAQDVDTPEGTLLNTGLETASGTGGLSLVKPWGIVGASASIYESGYGIPGGFIGAHPEGVSVDLNRRQFGVQAEFLGPLPAVSRLDAKADYTRYFHQEFESDGSLGIEFGLLTYHGSLVAHTRSLGPFERGAVGTWFEFRDYAAGGFSFTPATTEWTLAGFAFQDAHLGKTAIQGGLRYDVRRVQPSEEFDSDIGRVRARDFGGVSASVSVQRPLGQSFRAGLTAMRSLRLPGIEELYSEGPHLAAYSFETGNPDLPMERALGLEAAAHYQRSHFQVSVAAYTNRFESYIYPQNTGRLNTRVYLPIYQFAGTDAVMTGAETRVHWQGGPGWDISASAAYVRGQLTQLDQPIPWMPPLKGIIEVSRSIGALTLGAAARAAGRQDRVGAFEEPTAGFAVLDLSAEYFLTRGGMLHTISLGVDNLTDTAYRDHLSRVKSILPEPGRNVRMLYRLYF